MEKITKGRITYFEPNELFGDDNQPVNQEDLTKYVNLSVRIPSRFYNESALRRNYESVLKGTPFVEKDKNGNELTKLYLTDNYVNMSYTEFGRNGEISSGELFGIESINISFDVQFFPIVTINFTDIKGFGLMSTMEYNYEKGKINNLTAKSFFTSLFNFPYPIFTLEVKGYYGKSMSFDLALKDFNTSFESSTGNFKTTVSFIGHLYGIYSDIPMSYLLIAPYIDYNGGLDQDSNEECTGETWRNMGNNDLPTYLGILNKYEKLLKGEDIKSENVTTIAQYKELENNVYLLKEIIGLYDEIIMFAKTQAENMTITEDGCFAEKNENEESLVGKRTTTSHPFFSSGESFNIIYRTDENTLEGVCDSYKKLSDGITNGVYGEEFKLEIEKYDFAEKSGCTKYSYAYFKNIFYKKELYKNELIIYENKLKNTSKDALNDVNNMVSNILGFKPTIKNIYKILFKHLECFSKQFYNTIKNIDSNRIKKENTGYYIEDIEGLIPPFPMVYEIENNERRIIYPGKYDLLKNYPEIKLVENIYESVKYFSNKFNDSTLQLAQAETYRNENIIGHGSLFTDLKDYGKGNYFILTMSEFKPSSDDKMAEAIRDIFLARLNTYSKIHYKKDLPEYNENYFNKKEATLLYDSNPFLKKSVYNILNRFTNKKNELYERYRYLRGGADWGLTTFPPGSDELDNINDDYKHSNDKLENSLIIFKRGTKETCEAFISENFNSSFSYIFNEVKYEKYQDGYEINRYNTSLQPKPEECPSAIYKAEPIKHITSGTVYYDRAYKGLEHNPFFTWFAETYEYGAHIWSTDESYKYGCHFSLTCQDYNETTSKRYQLNKCVSISLAHLLGAGEAIYYGNNDKYVIPATIYSEDEVNWDDEVYFQYRRYFKNDTKFGKVVEGLYKTFYNKNPNDDDKKYYNYFEIPKYIKTTKDAYDYWFVIGKNFQYENDNSKIDQEELSIIFDNFLNKVGEMYNWNESTTDLKETTQKDKEVNDIKNNIYYTLKNLYEKWLSSLPSYYFNMNKPDSEFNRVQFLTTTFNDISSDLIVDIESFVKQIVTIKTDSEIYSKSVLSFMASTAQNNLCTFLILPTKIFNENLKDAFKPFSFFNGGINHDVNGSTYVVMYNSDVSHKLDIPGSETPQDGYMIADYIDGNLEITDECEKIMKIKKDHSYEISSFGVTYGMQNQNFFKKISVDTQTPQMTDYAIANTLTIAEHGNSLTSFDGSFVNPQSIYPVYANRSYNCSVEMMGCMNITPLMYFQLNNVPMFKGAYLITNVEHNITPNDFTTNFTGVRVSKYNIPLNKISIDMSRIESFVTTSEQNRGEVSFNSTIGMGEPVNIDDSKDKVNLDRIGYSCFYGYDHNCDRRDKTPNCGNDGNKDCCDCHRSAVLSVKCLLQKNGIYDDELYASRHNSIRLIYEKNYRLYYFCLEGEDYKDKYDAVVKSIINHLNYKRPVIVGVNHTFNQTTLNEGTSDHWVTIYAYGYSGSTLYFRYFESGSNHKSSSNRDDIFLYEDGDKPKLYNNRAYPSGGKGDPRRYDVTVVKLWHDISTLGYTLQDYELGNSVSSIPIDDLE